MSGPEGLSSDTFRLPDPGQGGARHRADEARRAVEAELAGRDLGKERITVHWILFLVLMGGAFLIGGSPWHSTPALHTLLESVATVLALMIGGLALVRFYSRKQATFLFIGTGFLGAALLDLNHALLTSEYFLIKEGAQAENLFAWTWTAERVYLSLFLLASFLVRRQAMQEGEAEGVREGSVYAYAVGLTLLNLFVFEWVPLSRAHFTGLWMTRPAEYLPGLLFLVTFVGYFAKGGWRRDAFEHWLLISLLIATMAHAAYMSLSQARFDAMFDAAHLLKVASYAAMLTGLLFSVHQTFRREGQVLAALTEANDALATEVSVRAKTEEALKEGRARLQDFLDNASDIIQSVAPDGRILYVNSAWKRTLGYTDEQLARIKLLEIVHPVHQAMVKEEFDRVLAGAPPRRFSVELLSAAGRVVIVSGSVAVQKVNGRPVATQGIFRDVTEQRLAERQLADSKANLAALVENTGDAIWSVDRNHRLITFNSAFSLAMEARTGREPKVGNVPQEVFPPGDVQWYQDVYRRAVRGDRHVAVRSDRVDGQLRYFELYANPIQGDGGITGAVLFGKDVTPRARAEEALRVAKEEAEAANKAKSDFLASMSHELRTPLNSVIGFTNILLKNKAGHLTEKDLGFLQRVLANGKHLLELINEVLDLAKIEAGRMELLIEPVDIGALITETVQQLEGQPKVKEGNVALLARIPEGLAPVETDPAKLKQVIINLVGNALKFTQEGSVTVRLEVGPDGRVPVAIAVTDTGIGIPDDRMSAVFEAFQQAEAGTARKFGGTGLGLAISRSLCLLMGYDLIVESRVGEGSTFTIVMGTRAKRPERPTQAEDTSAKAVAGESAVHSAEGFGGTRLRDFKVLVVDDEKDSRDLMTHYLEEFGCQVVTATNGEACLTAAREARPDLITLDLMMPDMTGWDVLTRLKEDPELRRIPVVIVSIVAAEGRGRLLGAVDLVPKPFDREDLLRVLWRNLVRKRGGRILVADPDRATRAALSSYLDRLGLEVIEATTGSEALDLVRLEAPDAVILDLGVPEVDSRTFLSRLRSDPLHLGLPVLVLSGRPVPGEEADHLRDLASVVIEKGEGMTTRIGSALGSMFEVTIPPR